MVDLSLVVGFEWDAGNARKSVDRHGVTQGEAEAMFFLEPLLVVDEPGHSLTEPRFHALGCTPEGRLLQATFTLRGDGTLLRVISVRAMSRRERRIYADVT
ncbi:MAG: BrnT family toxin [Geminicoccaceae bacterium]